MKVATMVFFSSLAEEQGAPRQGGALEWVRRQTNQVAGVLTKQLVAPDKSEVSAPVSGVSGHRGRTGGRTPRPL